VSKEKEYEFLCNATYDDDAAPPYIEAMRGIVDTPVERPALSGNIYDEARFNRREKMRGLCKRYAELCRQFGPELGESYFAYVHGSEVFYLMYSQGADDDESSVAVMMLQGATERFAKVLVAMGRIPSLAVIAKTAELQAVQEVVLHANRSR